jgi:hypothetical protein
MILSNNDNNNIRRFELDKIDLMVGPCPNI